MSEQKENTGAAGAGGARRQMVTLGFAVYQCFKMDREWRRKKPDEKLQQIKEFHAACEGVSDRVDIKSYSTAGLKADVDFILWGKSKTLDGIHDLANAQLGTQLSKWMDLKYNYLAMLKGSPYEGTGSQKTVAPVGEFKWLFIYPFVKTRPWYALPMEERMRLMKGHIDMASEVEDIRINTSYSFGIDDQEFVVSFEGDHPDRFVNLVQKLRESEASSYTLRDTPMYVGARGPLDHILSNL
jgi:chlorite dismutase